MIVQLNNTVKYHRVKAFDCSWLSTYKEEDEVLFCGGHNAVRIESVHIIGTAKKYRAIFKFMGKFNEIFNGAALTTTKNWKEKETKRMRDFWDWRLGKCDLIYDDQYVFGMLDLFAQTKRHVFFSVDVQDPHLQEEDVNDWISEALFYKLEERGLQSDEDETNIFKRDLFKVFPNIRIMKINTSGALGGGECAFSLERFLLEIQDSMIETITIIAARKGSRAADVEMKNGTSWLLEKWTSSSEALIKMYGEHNFSINLKKPERSSSTKPFDSIVINKMY